MKIYFLVCFILLVLVVLRVLAEMLEYKRKYPHAKWQKVGTLHSICTWIKLFIIFCIPLVNVVLFASVFICADRATFESVFRQHVEFEW